MRKYAGSHPLHGLRRAWAHLRHDEGMSVNKKKAPTLEGGGSAGSDLPSTQTRRCQFLPADGS